jgi:hypothetical protein
MRFAKIFSLFLIMTSTASAANLTNVNVLGVNLGRESVAVKLHAPQGPEGSFFFVNIEKSDADSFVKLALLAKKLEQGESFVLNLDIRSFSMAPSGSTYRSESVTFSGTRVR